MEKEQLNQQQRPLFDALRKHKKLEKHSFHVPGHKNGLNWLDEMSEFKQLLAYDQTEVSGLDYLHEPTGVIEASQTLLSDFYKSKKSYYLVNGSTVGNLAMIMASVKRDDLILMTRDAHQSVIHGVELAGATPLFLGQVSEAEGTIKEGIEPAALKAVFKQYSGIKALVMTYPTYYGEIYPLKELIELAKANNCLVLVDEAHGAHFTLGSPFPVSALELGADVVVHSAHKMLPALTQASYLHIGKGSSIEFQREIEHYLHILQSSSPSYLLMMSLEYARYFLANWTLDDLKQTLAYVTFWENKLEQAGFDVLKTADPLKLNIRKTGYLGEELAIYFEEKGLFPELSTESFILLTFPLLKAQQPIQLPEVDLEQLESREVVEKKRPIVRYPQMATLALSYEQQKMKAVEFVDLEQAIRRISAVTVTPYPPGIPLILKGEEIKKEQLAVLKVGLAQFNRIVGLKNQNEILVFSH